MALRIALTVHVLHQFYMRKMGGETLTEAEFVGRRISNRQYLIFLLEAYRDFLKSAVESNGIFYDKEGAFYIDDRKSRLSIVFRAATQEQKEEFGEDIQYVNVTIYSMSKFREKVSRMLRIDGAIFKNATLVLKDNRKRVEESIRL